MWFECPYCGWTLYGGDEMGVQIEPPNDLDFDEDGHYAGINQKDLYTFYYCFHCGAPIEAVC